MTQTRLRSRREEKSDFADLTTYVNEEYDMMDDKSTENIDLTLRDHFFFIAIMVVSIIIGLIALPYIAVFALCILDGIAWIGSQYTAYTEHVMGKFK